MKYEFTKADDVDDNIIKAMKSREEEYNNYELNKINYQMMLKDMEHLPKEWPENLLKYKNIFGEKLAELLKGPDFELVTDLQFRDRVECLLATTIVEQKKGDRTHKALAAQLPNGPKRDAAVLRVMNGLKKV